VLFEHLEDACAIAISLVNKSFVNEMHRWDGSVYVIILSVQNMWGKTVLLGI